MNAGISTAGNSAGRRVVAFVTFPQFQLLDFAGPIDVFTVANRLSPKPPFDLVAVSTAGGPVPTTSGVEISTHPILDLDPASIDTLILVGGPREGIRPAVQDNQLRAWVASCSLSARRFGSVCSGSLVLARWGLLEGCRATTHWIASAALARHPGVDVEAASMYVKDGRVWTSGGVTSGIDMCLAMVEEDLGRVMATNIAKQLILSARRLGNQSQFSVLLETQAGKYAALMDWMLVNLRESITVERLSEIAGESPRTFHRRFSQETGMTPARFIEELRLQVARGKLEAGESVKAAARAGGFTSDEHLARVFRRRLDMTPSQYGLLHSR